MTNLKTTKRALLSSIVALLLCFTMLLGTTFAWFTDSVTSSGNIIQTGTLDVEMSWKDATASGPQQTYKDASEGAIFNYDKWEPGFIEAKNIKISNVGTLALKYHLNIAANGEVSELADVIDVYFAEGEYTLSGREMTDLALVGTLSDILDGMPANMAGDLKASTSDTVTIALKMQEDAGNEYQGLSIGTNFSVVLMATQDNVEKDAFDENYDDIEIPEMHIENINGVTYGVGADGNYYMISVDDYTLTTFTVDDEVTVLGTGDGENDNDRVFGKNAPLTSLTLPEGLTEIKDNALNALPNLTTVNFPTTLKTIGINGFKMTGMTEVTIPENVETIKKGAFRDMANLTTVTVEGNVAFDNYAFRSCPNLTSIYLLGDDVTFAGSQFATHSDNGDATGITIYVKNTTVAARVYAAQTSAYGYEVKVLGDAADGSDAVSVTQVKNA
ncbi:MAG: leucine-rich repeat protein, partial [Clostridia bacterium]|nr:leucine-rich repeat protein [Clostridia bacterium]